MAKGMNKLKKFFDSFQSNEIFTRSASLAYYSSLAMSPLLILTISLLGAVDFEMQELLVTEAKSVFGKKSAELLNAIITNSKQNLNLVKLSSWFSLIFLLFSASIIFRQLQLTLNIIFGANVEETEQEGLSFKDNFKEFIFERLLSVGMVFTFIFIIAISLIASSSISYIFAGNSIWLLRPVKVLINISIFTVLFGSIIKILPLKKVSFKRSFFAGLLISVMFVIGKSFIGIYLGNTALASAYGAAGSLAVLLVWLYYSSIIFFTGALVAQMFIMDNE